MKKLFILVLLAPVSSSIYAQGEVKFAKYLGDYSVENAPFTKIIISIKDGSFWGEAVGEGDSELLISEEENLFNLESVPNGTIQFTMDENGIVTRLALKVEDQMAEGIRQFPPLTDYAGVFKFEPGGPVSQIEVTELDGQISVETPEYGKGTISSTSIIDAFFEPNYQSDIIFIRNEEGEVDSLQVEVKSQGLSLVARKENKN